MKKALITDKKNSKKFFKNIKKFFFAFAFIGIFSSAVINLQYRAEAEDEISVYVDGEKIKLNGETPRHENGITYVPAEIIRKFDFDVEYDCESSTLICTKDDNEIKVPLSKNVIEINGKLVEVDDVSILSDKDHVLIPVRTVTTGFGAAIDWEETTKSILIGLPNIRYEKRLDPSETTTVEETTEETTEILTAVVDEAVEESSVAFLLNELEESSTSISEITTEETTEATTENIVVTIE